MIASSFENKYFAEGSAPLTRTDAFLDAAGQNLLAGLLLAAATAGQPILGAFSWLTEPLQEEPSTCCAMAAKSSRPRRCSG